MLKYEFSEESIHDLILKYADESFNVRDALNFEILIKQNPGHLRDAQINRTIRGKLQALPKIKAASGFEERLVKRLNGE